jgi:hypothetical protein
MATGGLKAETLRDARKKLAQARIMMAMGQYRAALPLLDSAHADCTFVREQTTMDKLMQEHETRVSSRLSTNG